MKGLIVLQYNCGNGNQKATRPFFDAAAPADYTMLSQFKNQGITTFREPRTAPRGTQGPIRQILRRKPASSSASRSMRLTGATNSLVPTWPSFI